MPGLQSRSQLAPKGRVPSALHEPKLPLVGASMPWQQPRHSHVPITYVATLSASMKAAACVVSPGSPSLGTPHLCSKPLRT